MTYLLHRRDPHNTGDWNCGPGQYFAFPDPVELDITRIREISPNQNDLLILGGGGMLGIFDAEMEIARSLPCRKVLWGVGGNKVGEEQDDYDTSWADLEGRRDKEPFLPCVSCMNPVWDMDVPVVREWTEIEHHSVRFGAPLNNSASIRKIAFEILSAEKVRTTSYHVAYWAHLMGREVDVPDKWSSKFHSMRPVRLEEARRLNREFYRKVQNL
ncbi:MAG TPA: hypothetical protein VKZ59_11055 [Acidobacteriota bacterium]|nr:hypothetical protein [Acidobacteriota bacterium]